jgi:hypothetical protein
MHISDLVTTKYVFVFMLIPLTNMNKGINQRWFAMYPKPGPVLEALVAPFLGLDIVSVRAV